MSSSCPFLPALWPCFLALNLFLGLGGCLLLVGDRAAPRTLAGARIGVRALAAHRKIPAVPQSAVSADLDQALDVHGDCLAQVAFDLALLLDDLTDAIDLFFVKVPHFFAAFHASAVEDGMRA